MGPSVSNSGSTKDRNPEAGTPPLASSTMARDRWGLRRTFRTPPGRSAVSWRWEVGLPLFVMGFVTAVIAVRADGAELLFWAAALVAGIGASLFFSGMLRR